MTSTDLFNSVYAQLDSLRSGSLSFWGNWFGRPYDNIHKIVGADSSDGVAVLYFDRGESLLIDAPRNWSLDGGCLFVCEAQRVRFQWFYYGSLPSRETFQFEEYRWEDGRLVFTTDFQSARRPVPSPSSPAVQLHALG